MYLEPEICWRRYCTSNVYYDMDNHDMCAFFVTENTSTWLVEIMLCEYGCNSLELCQISTIVLSMRMTLVLVWLVDKCSMCTSMFRVVWWLTTVVDHLFLYFVTILFHKPQVCTPISQSSYMNSSVVNHPAKGFNTWSICCSHTLTAETNKARLIAINCALVSNSDFGGVLARLFQPVCLPSFI